MSRLLTILLLLLAPIVAWAGGGDEGNSDADLIDYEKVSPSEDGLVLIEIPGVDAQDFLARFTGDTLFVPFTSFCDFLRIKSSISADRITLKGELGPGKSFEISRRTGTATAGTITVPFAPSQVRVAGGDVYVEQALIARVLGLASFFDPMRLKLRIAPDDQLPVVQWKQSKGRYAALAFEDRLPGIAMPSSIVRQPFSSPMINWMLTNTLNSGSRKSYAASLRLGQQVLFGTLDLSGIVAMQSGEGRSDLNVRLDAWTWKYQLPSSPLMRQVTLGRFPVADRQRDGIEITNRPLAPRIGFGSYNLTGLTRPGWTVEMYDGTRLVDMTEADSAGRYTFRVPMTYGTVDRTLRQVGPYGEVIIEQRRLEVNQEMLPAGEVEYSLSAGADSLDTKSSGAATASLAAGVSSWLTLGADAFYRTPEVTQWNADSVDPSALATIWLGGSNTLGLRYQVRSQLMSGEFHTISANNSMLRLGLDSVSVADRSFVSLLQANLALGQISVGGGVSYGRRVWGDEIEVMPQISGYAAGINFIASTRFTRSSLKDALESIVTDNITSSMRVMVAPLAGSLVSVAASYDHSSNKFLTLDFSTYYRLSENLGINLGYTIPELDWSRGIVQAQVSLDVNSFRASASSNYHNGSFEASSFAQGSAVVTAQGVHAFHDLSVGQSAIVIEAFRDENGNGTRDDGEEWLGAPQAEMTVGGARIQSRDGVFTAIAANRDCVVEIDRWDYAGDEIFPTRTRFSLYTLPSGVHVIEIPYSRGTDVTGRSTVQGEGEGKSSVYLNGLRAQLISDKTGAIYDGEVFSDGTMFFSGVAAGEYRINFDQDQLESRRLCLVSSPEAVVLGEEANRISETIVFTRCTK